MKFTCLKKVQRSVGCSVSPAAILSVIVCATAGCQTITVVNDRVPDSGEYPGNKWNHTGIMGLVNYSDDFEASRLCPNGPWRQMTLERGVAQVLIGIGGSLLVPPLGFFWTPLQVNWVCGKVQQPATASDAATVKLKVATTSHAAENR